MTYDKIVLLGDSLIEWRTKYPNGILQQLDRAYNRKLDVVARGYSGYTTTLLRLAWPYVAESLGSEKIRAIVLFIGSNDVSLPGTPQYVPLDKTLENLEWIINKLKEVSPNVVMVLPGLMDGREFPRDDKNTEKYATAMGELSQDLGVQVVDVRKVFGAGNFQYLVDGLHFTNDGYTLVGEAVLAALKKLGLDPDEMRMHLPYYGYLLEKPEGEVEDLLKEYQSRYG